MTSEAKYPTTALMIEQLALTQDRSFKRGYLGMSDLGNDCQTKLWFDFHFASPSKFKGETLLKFDDGHYSEYVTSKRLNKIPQVTLKVEVEDTGEQIGFSDIGGHLKGHMDGEITGVIQAPERTMVWEHKCVDHLAFNKLERLVKKHGEEHALEAWRNTYFVQAQMYMHYNRSTHHFLTVATSGSRSYMEVITPYHEPTFKKYHEVATDIICTDSVPERINERQVYPCNMCSHTAICFEQKLPVPTCRTCIFSEAISEGDDGQWWCHINLGPLSHSEQVQGCSLHLYKPEALKYFGTQIDADGKSVTYERKGDFKQLVNGSRCEEHTSAELYHMALRGE